MAQSIRILKNSYRDSVALMQLSAALLEIPGVEQASAIMATEGNLALLRETGLLGEGPIPGVAQPGASDLLVIVRARSDAAAAAAQGKADALLASGPATSTGTTGSSGPVAPRTLASALAASATAARAAPNLALVSVPGEYAAAEATKALKSGLNVMLFSDNVALADEVAMKRLAADKKLLLMGPDCGTAIIDGVPLGFANRVRRGAVGCIAASGTGLQQVTSLVDRLGAGISQAIGTGGRDLNAAVGGITMLEALSRLGRDADTKVIVLISKPPAPEVAKKVLAAAQRLRKPVVVNFIGADAKSIAGDNLFAAHTLEDAARMAVALSRGKRPTSGPTAAAARPARKLPKPGPGQHWIRGLFSGGTFCYEAAMLMDEAQAAGAFGAGGPSQVNCIWSNASVRAEGELDDPWSSREHTLVDLGDDTFTRGRPHPMIDQRLRNERLLAEAADPQVAVILFDVVLGDGSHPDPAGAMLPAIERARSMAAKKGRKLALVASVCGTAADTQQLERQESQLAKAGVLLAPSNAEAVRMAIDIVRVARPKASRPVKASSQAKTATKTKKQAPATSPRRGVKKEKA
jgi:FdrA protein